jgi:hypothetical protein
MLSANQVVKVRKAIETMYDSTCTVIVHEEYEKPNGATGFRDVTILEDAPCHVQYSSVPSAEQGDAVASVSQEIRLFISPDEEIPAGSKIVVDSVEYAHSGVSAKYATHQEIVLKLFERWS